MIQNIGYERFDGGIISDHRGMYMDLDVKLLQTNTDVYMRKMCSNQSTRVKKYRRKLIQYMQTKKIVKQVQKLTKINIQNWKPKYTKALQALDKDITHAMLKAERRCMLAHVVACWYGGVGCPLYSMIVGTKQSVAVCR